MHFAYEKPCTLHLRIRHSVQKVRFAHEKRCALYLRKISSMQRMRFAQRMCSMQRARCAGSCVLCVMVRMLCNPLQYALLCIQHGLFYLVCSIIRYSTSCSAPFELLCYMLQHILLCSIWTTLLYVIARPALLYLDCSAICFSMSCFALLSLEVRSALNRLTWSILLGLGCFAVQTFSSVRSVLDILLSVLSSIWAALLCRNVLYSTLPPIVILSKL